MPGTQETLFTKMIQLQYIKELITNLEEMFL